jgi:hypothetical protein|tara:strand:+ start:47 stop:349 length:303 start_codon:yes stop_codon:yes gene_type:complete
MKSGTLQGAYNTGKVGMALVAVFLVLVLCDVPLPELDLYVSLSLGVLGAITTVLTAYGARNFPTANRAPTSAEMLVNRPQILEGGTTGAQRAETLPASDP